MDHQKRSGLRDSISTSTQTTKSVSSQHTARPSLDEEYQLLTEQIVQLKMELATWKGKQDELNLARQHLYAERDALRDEIATVEAECLTYQDNTRQSRYEMGAAMRKLEEMRLNVANKEEEAALVRIEHERILKELAVAREELERVKAEETKKLQEIKKLEREKARVASEKIQVHSDVNEIQSDIKRMEQEMDTVQQDIDESLSKIEQLQVQLARVRKDNAIVCKKNDKIEARIVAMSTRR